MFKLLGEWAGGELPPDRGVLMHSSDSDRMLLSSKVVGLGDGHQPIGSLVTASRVGPT